MTNQSAIGCQLNTMSEPLTVVGMANSGEKLFPEEVVFSLIDGRYYADIL